MVGYKFAVCGWVARWWFRVVGMVSMFSLVVVGLDCSVWGLLYLVAFDMLVAGVFRFDN